MQAATTVGFEIREERKVEVETFWVLGKYYNMNFETMFPPVAEAR